MVSPCPYMCSFMLPESIYTTLAFKTHLLHFHSQFLEFKSFARPSSGAVLHDEDLYADFRDTNLTPDLFGELRTLSRNRPDSTPCNQLLYHYLNVKHVERDKHFYCCAYCTNYCDNLAELKMHTLAKHLTLRRKYATRKEFYMCITADCNCEYTHSNLH